MPNLPPLYYWDTCIWISWIMGENRPNREMDGVAEVVETVMKNKARIIVSDYLTAEMISGKWSKEAAQKFDDLFKRKNVKKVPISPNVTVLTQELRNHYEQLGGKNLSAGDAIHLATAILYRVDQFHTFDDGQRDRKNRSLLELNGSVAGRPLLICKPPATQFMLPGV
jgi:predicted nucleic acid-binding protein